MEFRRVIQALCIACCVLLSSLDSRAEVVYRSAARAGSQGSFDLDGDGNVDFDLGIRTASTSPDHLLIYFGIQQPSGAQNGVLTDGAHVPEILSGSPIGSAAELLVWSDGFTDLPIPGVSPAGNLAYLPAAPATQFIGVRFQADDGLHYGWVRLAKNYWAPYDFDDPNWPDDPGSVFNHELPRIDQFHPGVIDWAYESTPNTPIVAGAVPEPAAWILTLVCAASIATRRFGRRVLLVLVYISIIPATANAAIIHGIGQPLVDNPFIDMDLDGTIDFTLQNLVNNHPPVGASYHLSLEVDPSQRHSALLRDQYGVLLQFAAGKVIGSSFLSPVQWSEPGRGGLISSKVDGGAWFGPWETSPVGFLGARFERANDYHYGWIRVDLTGGMEPLPGGVGQLAYHFKVLDWAYESTPNTPIVTGAVPEPGTGALLCIAAVTCAAFKLRRRIYWRPAGRRFALILYVPCATMQKRSPDR